jgi:hypothetical protein
MEVAEVAMKNASHYRALASLYRQQAAYNPGQSWHLLGQAERWEHLAEQELASHFEDCNENSSNVQINKNVQINNNPSQPVAAPDDGTACDRIAPEGMTPAA